MTPQENSSLLQALARTTVFADANIKAQRGPSNDLAAILQLKGGKTVTFQPAEAFQRWYAERKTAR